MDIGSYICIDPSHGIVVDARGDDAPLVKLEFCNEVDKLNEKEKRCFLEMVQRDLAICLRMRSGSEEETPT